MRIVMLVALAGAVISSSTRALDLQYAIADLGVIHPGDFASQAFSISEGGVATGRSVGVANQAFAWTDAGGLVELPNLAGRPFGVANGANDLGLVVGTGSTTLFGSNPLPLLWTDGAVSQLPLPAGEVFGRANDINAGAVSVGSVGAGSGEKGVMYVGNVATVIATPTSIGCTMTAAFGVNDAGLVVGSGIDPNNAARNVGFVYDTSTDASFEVGALPGLNGALAFGVSNAGHVVGGSMLNQGDSTPFIWTQERGIVAIPLPAGTSQGSARAVNASGWVVGTASSAFAIPFLYDGQMTHRLADLLPEDSGWDLSTNTSSSALGISEDGVIVGTGVHEGQTRAYAMIPVAGCGADCNEDGALNILDFLCFQGAWQSQDDAGDCDADEQFNILDFLCFQSLFTTGCP